MSIILNILSTTFYVFEEISWRKCRRNTVPLSHIRSTVSDGVSPSPRARGGASSAPAKSATGHSESRWRRFHRTARRTVDLGYYSTPVDTEDVPIANWSLSTYAVQARLLCGNTTAENRKYSAKTAKEPHWPQSKREPSESCRKTIAAFRRRK